MVAALEFRSGVCTRLAPLILTNGVTVSALYWAQSVVPLSATEFGPSTAIGLMPGAALAGYAIGVAMLATLAPDLTSPRGLGMHTAFLASALCAAAGASRAEIAAVAFFFIGLGCSLTQRLLACGISAVPANQRSQTIGWIIAAGLCGIILARALVPLGSSLLGWRTMFWSAAVLVALCGVTATIASARIGPCSAGQARVRLPTALALWQSESQLRRAAMQQAFVFAAFNMAWALYPRVLAASTATPSLWMGGVATLGAAAAIISGRVCSRHDPVMIARIGLVAVAVASATFLAAGDRSGIGSAAMALLDIGTQVALVANQARAQALGRSPAMRGRVAAIVTTVGFAGGAIGAAIGNFMP